ncbi:hypothetical protein GO496_10625 [Acidovorax citrulli]|nr:hypothetical protein [Paracidovorax citrulli]
MSDTKSPAEQPAALKELTYAGAAKRVQRKVVERVEAKGEDWKARHAGARKARARQSR